jgi:hypothetical protein
VNNQPWGGTLHLGGGQILYGRLGEENPNHPGVYRFVSSDGKAVADAHVLTSDADIKGNGQNAKPTPGSMCVVGMTNDGAQAFVIGFHNPPQFDENTNTPPSVGNPADNNTSGDKVTKTSGGASITLKRGGSVVLEGGAGTGVILNPLNNAMSLRSQNFTIIADGYKATRGRTEIGKTNPSTTHVDAFLHQVGAVFDRVTISHGDLPNSARRQTLIESVTMAGSTENAIPKTRETYNSDGSWVGEGPKYQWGGAGATEPAVLGNQLVTVIGSFIDIVKALQVNTAWGPSTPPLPTTVLALDQLKSQLTQQILSTFLFLSKNATPLT